MDRRHFLAGSAAFGCMPWAARAQAPSAFPAGNLRLIASTSPGAGLDITSRMLADKLSAQYRKSVIVENKPGANGIVAVNTFKMAEDSHTLLVADVGVVSINPVLLKSLPYEPNTDFVPVTEMFRTNFVFVTLPDRFASLEALMAAAKARPGRLNFGAGGAGSGQRLSVELFLAQAGLKMGFIPYRGNSEALNALLGGDLDLVSIGLPPIKGHLATGRLKAIATTGATRSPLLPEVPTVAELAQLPGYTADSWVGLFAKPKTPPEVVRQLQNDVAVALKSPDVQAYYRANDYATGGDSSEAFARRIAADRETYRKVIQSAGITVD